MKIICPQCAFERDVPTERLPGASAIATCPQCQHRFRVLRAVSLSTDTLAESTASEIHANTENTPHDPLPPGAHIPKHTTGDLEKTERNTTYDDEVQGDSAKSTVTQSTDTKTQDMPSQSPAVHITKDAQQEERSETASDFAQQNGDTQYGLLHNPWEYSEKIGYLTAFYQTSIAVMFAAPRFFAGLMPQGSRKKAFIFYIIVGILQVCVERLWSSVLSSTLATSVSGDSQLQSLLSMLSSQNDVFFAILLHVALSSLEILMASIFYFLVFKLIAPQQANYPLVFQVIAYSSAPLLLCVVPMIGSVVGILWSIACTFVGCRHALRLTWTQTIIGIMPLYLLGLVSFFHIMNTIQGTV